MHQSSVFCLCSLSTIIFLVAAGTGESPPPSSSASKDKEECAVALAGLATCVPYVTGSGRAPTPDCCSSLKQLLVTNKKCLCLLIKDRNDLGLNINLTLALSLPDACDAAPINISNCPALLQLPPNSPEAKDFYQLGKNSSGAAGSPVAGGPVSSPARVRPGEAGGRQSNSCRLNRAGRGLHGWTAFVILVSVLVIITV